MTENAVTRYVATRLNSVGDRVLASAAQGRNTFATSKEAQDWIDAVRMNNNADSIAFLRPDTLEVRSCECWPGHFDPKGVYFDMVTTAGVCKHCGSVGTVGEECGNCEPQDDLGPMIYQAAEVPSVPPR